MSYEQSNSDGLFQEALKRANHIERHVYLTAACGNNTMLWNEVWDRLRKHGGTTYQPRKTKGIRVRSTPLKASASEKPGEMIGPYKLRQIVGEGATSVVWMAERDGRVLDCLAIKIIKAAAPDFLAHYEEQKHALALLDHPGIAKAYSSGITPGGKPFVVMELLQAVPITQFCDEQKLPLLLRIRLFLQACEAIHHAHQKGVVHGDIKPANLLVKWDGARQPVLKITDFGIARAMNHVVITASGQLRTPPAYLSPELAESSRSDARADIYALGMLLYEMITGRLPFVLPERATSGPDDVMRLVRETFIPKPSACLSALPKAQLTGIALNRQVEPTKLISLAKDHFDPVVMRGLEKNPPDRYATAIALAEDLQRYVAEESVAETPRMAGSHLGNFISEHRSLFAAAAVLLVTLTTAVALAGWLLLGDKEQQSRTAAMQKTEGNYLAAKFLEKMFAGLTPEQVAGHDIKLLKNMLDDATYRLDTLQEHPEAAARLQEMIGLTYLTLSQQADAQTQLQGALDKRKLALGGEHPDTLRSMQHLATAFTEQGRHEEAEILLRQMLAIQQHTLGPDHKDTFLTITVLAAVCDEQDKHLEAETLFLNLWQVQKRVLGPDHLETLATMGGLADLYRGQGKFKEAMKLRGEHLETMKRLHGPKDPRTLVAMNLTAQACEAGGMPSEAETLYFGALEIMKQTLGLEHPDTLAQLDRAALMQGRRGQHAAALKLHRQSLVAKQRVFGAEHPQTLLSMKCVADACDALGKRAEAESTHLSVLETMQAAFGPGHPETLGQMDRAAQVYERHGKQAAAAELHQQALEIKQRVLGRSHPQTLRTMQRLAAAQDAAGQTALAEALNLEALETMQAAFGPGDPDALAQMQTLAFMKMRHGSLEEAEALFLQLLQIQQRSLGPNHADTLGTMTGLAETYQRQNKLPEAEKLYQQALEELQQQPNADPPALAAAAASLGDFWLQTGKFVEAETVLRTSLELRRQHSPDLWQRFHAESQLGGALLGQKKFAEAGTLLHSGYAGLNTHNTEIPETSRHHLRNALERLVQFTENTGDATQSAIWRQKLAEFDQPRQIASF